MGNHWFTKKFLLQNYKSFGMNKINYDPGVIDSGDPKFIYVRQKYSEDKTSCTLTIFTRVNTYATNGQNYEYILLHILLLIL